MFDWNDLRFFLAAARTGNSVAAGEAVNTSPSTVTRRIAALETALRLRLFERTPHGYRPTDQALALLPLAEAAEANICELVEAAGIAKHQLKGRIRFAVPPTSLILSPVVEFMRRHPGVAVEVIPASTFQDVAGGEVDVAFRAGPRPSEPDLIVRKIGDVVWQGCCSKEYREMNGVPAGYSELAGHPLCLAEGPLAESAPFRCFAELVGRSEHRASSVDGLIAFVRTNAGITILPEQTISELDDIVACLPPLERAPSETWLITRDDLRRTPHVRAFLDFIVTHLAVLLVRKPKA